MEFKNYDEIVPQNSRTIIFEKFGDYNFLNEQLPDLATELSACQDNNYYITIADKLTITSFEEFIEKFEPVVYEIIEKDEFGRLHFGYSLDKGNGRPIKLCTHAFYKAVHDFSIEKANSAKNNVTINYEAFQAPFNPEKQLQEAHRKRKVLNSYVQKMLEAKEKNNPTEYNRYGESFTREVNDILGEYEGNALKLIPLKIADTQRVLRLKADNKMDVDENAGVSIESTKPLMLCTAEWDEDGEIVVKSVDVPTSGADSSKQTAVLDTSQKFMMTLLEKRPEGSLNMPLIMSTYCEKDNTSLLLQPKEVLENDVRKYSEIYANAQRSFCDAVVQLVQKVSNVEVFFNHAADDKGKVEAGVLIANCSIDAFKEDKLKNRLRTFLEVLKNDEKLKIWFAILPSITDSRGAFVENVKSDTAFMDIDDFGFGEEKEAPVEGASVSDINFMVKLLAECDILSFSNFRTCEATGFKNFGIDTEILETYKSELSGIENPRSFVLAHPNFTILPKGEVKVNIGDDTLYIPGVYVDAAYVAAGLVVASQTPAIQKKLFPADAIIEKTPFVHFNLEEQKNSEKFPTRFNPESRLNMKKEVNDYICGKDGNFFCFVSDSLSNHALILSARTFDGRPIYQNLLARYLRFYLSRSFRPIGKQVGNQFVKQLEKHRTNTDEKCVNRMYVEGEEFAFNDDTNRFTMKFISVEEPIDLDIDVID